MRGLRWLYSAGALAVAGSSWLLASALTARVLSHRHPMGTEQLTVLRVDGAVLTLALSSVVLACLAGVLVVALATGAATGPATGGEHGPRSGVTDELTSWTTGARWVPAGMAMLAVLDAWGRARGGEIVPHPVLLVLVALLQTAVGALGQVLWRWCVETLGWFGGRWEGSQAGLPLSASLTPERREPSLAGHGVEVRSGRAPPRLIAGGELHFILAAG